MTLPRVLDEDGHVFHLYVIRIPDREGLWAHLQKRDIGAGAHYPVPLHLQPAYAHLGYKEGDFPVAELLSERVLQLPVYPGLKKKELEEIAISVHEFLAMNADGGMEAPAEVEAPAEEEYEE